MQMTLGQVQIDRRVFQVPVAQQQLDGTQISTGFQQPRGKGVAQGVRPDALSDPGLRGRSLTGVPNRRVGDGSLHSSMAGGTGNR